MIVKLKWLKGWLSGKPHFIVGGKDDPYLYRWYVIPRSESLPHFKEGASTEIRRKLKGETNAKV